MTTTKKAGTPILEGKHTVVLGAGGSIGAAVAREFAAEGAEVSWLDGRNRMWKKSRSKSRQQVARPMFRL